MMSRPPTLRSRQRPLVQKRPKQHWALDRHPNQPCGRSELTLTGSITAEVSAPRCGINSEHRHLDGNNPCRSSGKEATQGQPGWRQHLHHRRADPGSFSLGLCFDQRSGWRGCLRHPLAGDVYLITGGDSHLQFIDTSSNVQELAYLSDVTASNTSVAAETTRAEAAEATLGLDRHPNQPCGSI